MQGVRKFAWLLNWISTWESNKPFHHKPCYVMQHKGEFTNLTIRSQYLMIKMFKSNVRNDRRRNQSVHRKHQRQVLHVWLHCKCQWSSHSTGPGFVAYHDGISSLSSIPRTKSREDSNQVNVEATLGHILDLSRDLRCMLIAWHLTRCGNCAH